MNSFGYKKKTEKQSPCWNRLGSTESFRKLLDNTYKETELKIQRINLNQVT